MIRTAVLFVCIMTSLSRADVRVAGLKDLGQADTLPAGWQLSSAALGQASGGALPPVGPLVAMNRQGEGWTGDGCSWRVPDAKLVAQPAAGRAAVAAYTVQPGGAGFYAITDSLLRRADTNKGRVELRVVVRHQDGRDEPPAVRTCLDAGELFDFDQFLGYLDAGDAVLVFIGPDGDAAGDLTEVDFEITRVPATVLSVYPADGGRWSILRDVSASPAGRVVGWQPPGELPTTLSIKPGDRETVVATRVSHSGYYALHNASATATGSVQASLYAGRSATPRRSVVVPAGQAPVTVAGDIGYVEKGDLVCLAFRNTGSSEASVTLSASLAEWAPRTPPLRVSRGADGYLDVIEPADPRKPLDIPVDRWIAVPPQNGDATEAIHSAFEQARQRSREDGYVGIRLERGAIYTVATDQVGGDLFTLRDLRRVVFDGNGATLNIASREYSRKGIKFFTTQNSNGVVLADFTVTANTVPFAIGRVIDVGPMQGGNQAVTFRLEPGSLDPVADIATSGNSPAYCYDPVTPGRMAVGTWTHYPGAGTAPQIRATGEKGVFTHTVTRTGNSIPVGSKWLTKNKGAGLAYLTTRGSSSDITLWKINGQAPGGGLLYFWGTSRINILDCRFEPVGENWIGSSSDAVHGRGREGVWIEDTLIRGVCEDVMNTYSQTMVVVPDDNPADNVMTIRMLVRPTGDNAGGKFRTGDLTKEAMAVGEKLVFFNPRTGHVLGHATVREINDGKCTLSNPIPDIDTWEPGDEKGATVVYNTATAARFYVRDSHFMDSMRFAVYIKARGGVLFNNTFDGFSSPAVLVMNEPEWPEGPPGTHVWIQGNTFSQNNYGYMSRNRAFTAVDPADISIYTRHMRSQGDPTDYTGFITHGQYANSHVKVIGNTFHDWRGGGIAIRNSRNAVVENNSFLPPVDDEVMRQTLKKDKLRDGRYAAIFLASVDGARVRGNRFFGLTANDQPVLRDQLVEDVTEADNEASPANGRGVNLPFSEWFGNASASIGPLKARVELRGVKHVAGRLGAGLLFDGGEALATVHLPDEVTGSARKQFSVALWVRPSGTAAEPQGVWSHGDAMIAIIDGRLVAGVERARLDLGPAVPQTWQHVALSFDGEAGVIRGFLSGMEVAATKGGPKTAHLPAAAAIGKGYHGLVDEVSVFGEAITPKEISPLSLGR